MGTPAAGGDRFVPRWGRLTRATATGVLVALAATLAVAVAPQPAAAATQTVSNTTAIAIPAVQQLSTPPHATGSLYPSPVTISALTGTVTKVTATLNNLTHTFNRDLDILLVGPAGQSVVLLSDAGGNNSVTNANVTFDDAAASQVSDAGNIVTGTYKPTNTGDGITPADLWPSPAPSSGYGATMAVFNGTNPNGVWNLYITDDASGDYGNLAGGWTLTVETGVATFPGQLQLSQVEYRGTEGGGVATVTIDRVTGDDGPVGVTLATGTGTATNGVDYTAVSQAVSFADGQTSRTVDIPILDDGIDEGIDELVPITLSSPTGGATLGSPTSGQIRVQDNDARRNTFPITIPAGAVGPAGPYPSNIVVAGAGGVVTDVDVTLDGLTHTHVRDVDMLLVAPNGATTLLLQDAGGGTAFPISDRDITFSDEAAGSIPNGDIPTGSYKPTQVDDSEIDTLPAPAPAGPWGTTLAALDGSSPNGTWSLYVFDDAGGDSGQIATGWSLALQTATASAGGPYTAAEGSSVGLSGSTTPALTGATYEWDVDGDGQYDDATGQTPTVSASTLSSIGLGDGPDSASVRVRVTAGLAVITSAATTLTITNVAPTATFSNTGPVVIGSTADVSFSGQTDPSSADTTAGFRYSYDFDDDGDWEVGDGTYAGSNTSASATVPTTVLTAVGTYEVNGLILDKDGGQTPYTTTITVDPPPNADPVADAGPDQAVNPGATVTLDGTGSDDADDDPLTYAWDQTAGTTVTLSDATAAQPTFTAPSSGSVTFQLTVDDGQGGTDTDTVTITINQAPVADPGDDQTVDEGDTVTLDGTGSTDPESGTLDYDWDQTAGPTVTLSDATAAQPTFTAPDGPATLTFELTVTDPLGRTDTDTVVITVNDRPVADAGPDQTVDAGATVTLDGTDSTDTEGAVTYAWAQTGGTGVTLSDATAAQPTFTAPAGAATLTFTLTVTDGNSATDTDSVTITVDGPPVADAGPDQDVVEGDTVTLDGTGSTDPESGTLDYDWDQTAGPTVTLSDATDDSPTFTAPAAGGTLTFTLTVTDDRGQTDTDTVAIVVDRIPTADAGPDQDVDGGDTVTLDGTGSTDPDSDTLTYAWDQISGAAVTLTGATTATPSFTAPTGPAVLTFRLTVDDGRGGADVDVVTITVNGIPTADAGPDQDVDGADTVTLDGTGSTDPDSDTLTYSWQQTTGSAVTLTGATTATPSFTAPTGPATLTFELTVTDGRGGSDTDTVTVTVNGIPTADAGPDQEVNLGDTVTLDGTGSTDPDSGTTLTYSWEQTGGGTVVTLTGADTAQPTFTAPEGPDVLVFTLTVDDGNGGTDTDTVTITVNGPPVADAGPDQSADLGEAVTLDGTGSTDPDGDTLTYSWVQTAGPAVTLVGSNTAQPTFTAPAGPGTLTFQLTVDDGQGRTDTDEVSVALNGAPIADAGDDDEVNPGDPVTLDGTGSTDPDSDTLTYSWQQTAGPAVTLTGATTAAPSFTSPAGPATLTFELTVDDGHGGTDTDTVTITVNGTPVADAGPDQEVNLGDTVTLDGTGSTDPDTDTLTYSWEQTGGGTVVTLTGADTAQPTFTAPEGPDVLVFTLTVEDPGGETDTDSVTITINGPPTADAGPDQSADLGETVTLDGTGSTDPDSGTTLTYSWVQTAGPAVVLVGANTATPTFTAPAGLGTLTFELTVDDGQGRTDTDEVSVALNGAPIADAGDDDEVEPGETVTLDGTGSTDPDTDTLTYSWIQTAGTAVVVTGANTAQPTFTAPTGPATLTFELTVDDGNGGTDTDTVTITVNGTPVADAGPDQLVNAGDTVTLDGTGSTDPDTDTLTHSWVQTGGGTVTLTGANTAQPTFTAPTGPATLTFELTVTDPGGETDTDTVTITVNGVPVADAGDDQLVVAGATVTLDGTGSTDPDSGTTLTYSWQQTAGTAVTLVGATTAQPTFTAPTGPATLTFELTVDDGNGGTDTDTVTITVDGPPTADAGDDQEVNAGDTVTLDGTGSTDPDTGDELDHSWTQTAGPTVTLTGATTAQPTFTAPTGPATLTFELTVTDESGISDTDTVTVTVNGIPTADAGPDQEVNLGDTVTLDGTGSTDPDTDTLTHGWEQTGGGTVVTLTGADTAQPTFTAPEGPDVLVFTLTVEDPGGETDTDSVTITINGPPTAAAGDDAEAVERTAVTLDGTDSTDPDGDPLTYSWAQTGGTAVTLTGATTASPSFTVPDAPATVTLTLTVDDGQGRTDTDSVTITSLPRFTPTEAWVDHTYRVLLGRESDAPGRAYWVDRLANGTTRSYVAKHIAFSAEATMGRVLDQRFEAWLGRLPSLGDRAYWAPRLHGGTPILALELSLLTSNEIYARLGGTSTAYVNGLYELLLGRAPGSGELAYWQTTLALFGRSPVARGILTSTEAERRRVANAYEEMLGRPADPGGLTYWAGVLDDTNDLRRVEFRLAAAWVNQPGSST